MAWQRRSIGTFAPGVPLERAYRVAPDKDLGGWFESDGEMTVYVIDGEIELTLENEGSWRLGAGEAISHPADIRHRWAVVGDGAARILLSVAHAHPAAGPVPLPAPDGQAGHSIHRCSRP
jgi:quercetin dioxygenase-like cupin family protein